MTPEVEYCKSETPLEMSAVLNEEIEADEVITIHQR
jgi:hypothetical protein